MYDNRFSTKDNERIPKTTTNNGLFFTDGIRQIDFVLAYQKLNDNERNRKIRSKFLKILMKQGLEFEIQDEEGNLFSLENFDNRDDTEKIVFIKLFAKWETLCHYAELLRIRKPILHPPSNIKYEQSLSFRKYFRKFDIFNLYFGNSFHSRTHTFTMPFSSSKEYLFDIPANRQYFFIQTERSLIVNYILRSITLQCNRNKCNILANIIHPKSTPSSITEMEMRTFSTINSESECSKSHSNNDETDEGLTEIHHLIQTNDKLTNMSLHNLISEQVFESAYCLHESFIVQNSLKRDESDRVKLYKCWGLTRNICRSQPLDSIRSYFGEKIAFYFSWLGFYTYWLFFPSLLGLVIAVFNILHASSDIIVNEIKEGGNITMCPLLCNSKQCKFWKLSDVYYKFFVIRILDNKTMILMAFSMSIWASLFLEMWKREQFRLAFHWNVYDLQNQYEPQKPEFVAFITQNQTDKGNESSVPFWRRTVPFMFFKFSTVLFSVILALAFLVGIILYEIVIYALLMMHPSPLVTQMSNVIISVTGSIISLIVILLLTMVYAKLAHWLTGLENNETQSEYDDSVTMKLYLLEFINNYSYLFYFGFILPLIQPIPGFKAMSDLKPIGCPTGGCLFGLSVQLAFIMIGRQLISHFTEYSYPLLCSSIKKYKLRKCNKVKYRSKNITNVNAEIIRCYDDLLLADLESQPVFYEYLEMLIQFGFITMFIPAFPLAPLLALFNNLLEIRNDATKFLTAYKRPGKYLEAQINKDTIINLYHLDIYENPSYLQREFGDVKIVCMGGKASRMRELAKIWGKYCNIHNFEKDLHDYSGAGDRFSMFKVYKIIFLSHGMGIPSISIALNEVTKLLHFAGVTDPLFIRIGTCGGLGLAPGTIVVSEYCYDSQLNDYQEIFVCGQSIKKKAILDKSCISEFINVSELFVGSESKVKIVKANTMCANDFYEEQARMDGPCNHITVDNKDAFFQKLINEYGIRNIEMESLGFAAFCHNLGIRGMVIALILVDRLVSDFVSISLNEIKHHQRVVNEILMNYFKTQLE